MVRVIKVTNQPQGKKYVPGISIKGNYVKLAFALGDVLNVDIDKDMILITKKQPG